MLESLFILTLDKQVRFSHKIVDPLVVLCTWLDLAGGLCAVVLVPQLMGIILGRLLVGQIESQLDQNQLAARRRWNRRGIL